MSRKFSPTRPEPSKSQYQMELNRSSAFQTYFAIDILEHANSHQRY
jgi:hypothetical protein